MFKGTSREFVYKTRLPKSDRRVRVSFRHRAFAIDHWPTIMEFIVLPIKPP